MSASSNPTRAPDRASEAATFALTVDLPTPPLPLAMATKCSTPGTSRLRPACAGGRGAAVGGGALGATARGGDGGDGCEGGDAGGFRRKNMRSATSPVATLLPSLASLLS